MRGVFLDTGTIGPGDLDLEPLTATLDNWSLPELTGPDQLQQVLSDADIVVTNKVVLDQDSLLAANTLSLVCVAATGPALPVKSTSTRLSPTVTRTRIGTGVSVTPSSSKASSNS